MPMIMRGAAVLLIGLVQMIGAATAAGSLECAPVLAFKQIRFSKMRPPTLERKWTESYRSMHPNVRQIPADTLRSYLRGSAVAPDLEFRERYAWRPPSVEVVVNFAANEAVERYRVASITSCACRD